MSNESAAHKSYHWIFIPQDELYLKLVNLVCNSRILGASMQMVGKF